MKWIKVSERLPEHLESVLVWGEGYNVLEACYYNYGNDSGDGFNIEECGYDGGEQVVCPWVTHWMPFPNPPKL